MLCLPQEIQDIIVDQLNADEAALLNCSLVSKAWLARARQWCFLDHEVLLQYDTEELEEDEIRANSRFIELLHSPHSTLASQIRSVCLIGPNDHYFPGSGVEYELFSNITTRHLSLFRNLRNVTLERITWDRLSPEAKSVISSLGQTTSITWRTAVVQHPVDLFALCATSYPNLEVLKIGDISFTHLATPQGLSDLALSLPCLRFLEVEAVMQPALYPLFTVSPTPCLRPQTIETLCITQIRSLEDAAIVGQFIEVVGPGLRSLELGLCDFAAQGDSSYVFPITLCQNSNLRKLNLSLCYWDSSGANRNPPWLRTVISSISSQKLSKLVVGFSIPHGKLMEKASEHLCFEYLEYTLLERLEAIHYLEIVELKFFTMMSFTENDFHQLEGVVARSLPVLHERRCLRVIHPLFGNSRLEEDSLK